MKQNKLVLGTAQLGLNYGIANKIGKPEENKAFEIMKYAIENGINYFDTAYSYGNSEIIIGKFLNSYKNYKNKVNIITKMPSLKEEKLDEKNINDRFFESLYRLDQESIFCYMVHDFNDIKNNSYLVLNTFFKLKNEGYIKKIGVSVYNENQIKFLIRNFDFDLIQIPINIFDQRVLKDDILLDLKKRGIEIYARSVFLQGLIFLDRDNLPPKFKSIEKYLEKINNISLKFNIPKEDIALLFINSINEIDRIIIGVEKIEQLKKNIGALNRSENFAEIERAINFQDLFIENKEIIDPRKW